MEETEALNQFPGSVEFVASAVQGQHVESIIDIPGIPTIYHAISLALKGQPVSIPASEIVDMMWLNLTAFCPQCGMLMHGDQIGKCYMIRHEIDQGNKVSVVGGGRALRFIRGLCPNESCSSTTMSLSWQPLFDILKRGTDLGAVVGILLRNSSWFARSKAAQALGERGNCVQTEPLIQGLTDDSAAVRWEAARALGKIGDPRATVPLRTVSLHDDNKLVREAAGDALKRLGTEG